MREYDDAVTEPLVSIIVPVYNVEKYIGDCIKSIIQQSYKKIEVLIIDDCGSDASVSIAVEMLQESTVLWKCICHDNNKGLSASRNTGVEYAAGRYIYFVDSDDFLNRDAIRILVDIAITSNADVVFALHVRYKDDGCISTDDVHHPNNFESNPYVAYRSECYAWTAWNRLINRNWYVSTGVRFIEGILHEDMPWSLSLALRDCKIAYADKVTYYYRERSGSIMTSHLLSDKGFMGVLEWLRVSRSEIGRLGTSLPDDYHEYHNYVLYRALLYGCKISKLTEAQVRVLASLAWKPKNVSLVKSNYHKTVRLFYIIRHVVGDYYAMQFIVKLLRFIKRRYAY